MASVLLGGALSGFACFWTSSSDGDGEDWRRCPEADQPPDAPIDWAQFDRLRAQCGRHPRVKR